MRLLGWLAGALGWSLIALGASHMFAFAGGLAAACLVPWASRRIQAAADARTPVTPEPNVQPISDEEHLRLAIAVLGALPREKRLEALGAVGRRWGLSDHVTERAN